MTFEEWWDSTLRDKPAVIELKRDRLAVYNVAKTTAKLAFAAGQLQATNSLDGFRAWLSFHTG